MSDPHNALIHLMRQFWQLESLGITANEPSVMDIFQQQICYDGNRYTVRLPWREYHDTLSDNHRLCVQRLQSILRRLRRTPELLKEYDKVIRDQISRGIVQEVPVVQDDLAAVIHYLPHHHVVRQDKTTTKVRVVYDAYARGRPHPSLNDCLYTGPPLFEQITDILLRFRSHAVAFTADIKKAFLMVGIHEADRDVLRFLWTKDPLADPPKVKRYRFTRVLFGVLSSPFLLNATIRHHLSQCEPKSASQLQKSLYVDDVANGGTCDDDALQAFKKAKTSLASGGFNLRKFQLNSAHLESIVNPDTASPSVPTVSGDADSYAKSTLNG